MPSMALPPCWKSYSQMVWVLLAVMVSIRKPLHPDKPCAHIPTPQFSAHQETNLNLAKTDKISIVIALRIYKYAETFDDRAICVERHNFVFMRQLLWSMCYSRKVEWTPSRMATWPGTKTRRAPTPRWDRRNKKTLWDTIKRPKSTPLVLFSAFYSMQKLWKF